MEIKKKIMLVVSMAIITLSTVLSSMQVHAADTYYLPYSEPSTSDTQGYVSVLLRTADGSLITNTFMWSLASDSYHQPYMIVSITPNSVGFVPTVDGPTDNIRGYCCITRYSSSGSLLVDSNFEITDQFANFKKTFTETVIGYVVRGNACKINSSISPVPFHVIFANDSSSLLLKNIVELLTSMSASTNNTDLISKLTSIVNNTDTIETKLQSLITLLDTEISSMVADLDSISAQINTFFPQYVGWFSSIVTELRGLSSTLNEYLPDIALDVDSISTKINAYFDVFVGRMNEIIAQLDTANDTLDSIDSTAYQTLTELKALHSTIKSQSNTDKNVTDDFKQDSDSQSNELNELNGQAQPDKIDVDNASGTVDQNLDIDTDANYGVLLSTFTSNGKILTMLLAVTSMALISYVLFGKR